MSDDYDHDEENELRSQVRHLRRITRQRTRHWHPQDPDYMEYDDDDDDDSTAVSD